MAHYTFDGNVLDSSGNGHDGTINGAGTSYVAGKFGQALKFTGSQDVSVPYTPAFALNTFTASAWVNLSVAPISSGVMGTRVPGENTFDLKVNSGVIHGDVGNGSSWINTSIDIGAADTGSNGQGGNISQQINTWHMITYVIDNTAKQFRLYLNADLKRTISFNGVPMFMTPTNRLTIGSSHPDELMSGLIDDVYIFDRALASEDIQYLYNNTGGLSILPASTAVIITGTGKLDLNGIDQSIGSLSGTADASVLLASSKLTVGSDNASTEFAGTLSQSGTITKTGMGTLALSGANTFSGTTTVTGTGSRLSLKHAAALGTSSATVQTGAQLAVDIAGNATIVALLTLNGDGGGSGALQTQQGSVTWNAPVTLFSDAMINTAPTTDLTLAQTLSGAGGLTKNGAGTLVVSDASSYSGATTVFAGILQFDGTFSSANSVAVAAGAVLKPGAAGMTMSSLSINDSAYLSLRIPTSASAPKLTVNGTATFGALSILQLDLENYPDGAGSSFTIVDAQTMPAHIGSLNKVNDSGTPDTPVIDYVNGARQTAVLTLNNVPATTLAATDASIQFRASAQTVLLSATVTSAGGPVNAGTVSFQIKQDQTNIGSGATSGTVNNGAASATYTIPAGTAVGTYSINAGYNGAVNFRPSSDSSKTLTITKAASTVTPANATTSYSFADQTVVLSAQVTSAAGVVNEGTVTIQLKSSGAQNVGSAVTSPAITTDTASINYVIPGGTQQGAYTIQASYSGGVNFAASSDNLKTVTIQKATPVITWINPANISYGTPLGAAQLNASVGGIPGTFVYNPASGTSLAVGNAQQLSVTFTPNDTVNYNSAQKTVSINVTKAVLTVTANNQSKLFDTPNPPLTASYSGFVNNETAAVLTGAPTLTTTANTGSSPGTYPITITQGTLNAANYSFTFVNGTLTVSNTPAFFNLSAPNVPYGTATTNLSGKISFGVTGAVGITLNGVSKSATIDATGFFSADFSTASFDLGTYPIQYFYPGGGAVGPATDSKTLTVIKANPVITWANPADIPYGTQLSATQLNATANVAGTFAYTPAAGTVLQKGTHQLSVNFAPDDATRYNNASASVTLIVGLAEATITWATPADSSYGTALSDTQLNATADIAGTFVYSPPSGTILNAGDAQKLSLTFTPDDNVNYAVSHVDVFINVLKADQSITFAQIPDQEIGGPALTLTVSASSNLPLTISLVSGNATLQGNTLTLLGLGAITLRAEQAGDSNFNVAPTLEQTFHVIIIPPQLTNALSASGTQNQAFTFTLTASGTQPVTFESGTLPAGLALNANTGEISGTPTASGAFQISVTARNGGGMDTKTLTLVFASSGGGENHAPKFVSGALATPNPAAVNQEITFTISANDEDGDSVAIVWDFGDGTQGFGATSAHRYAAAGVFAARVAITDGAASDYLNLTVVVNGSVIPPDQYKQYVVSKLALKFNFAKANADSLSISGTIPIQPAFSPEGKVVKFESGEFERQWTLDKKATSADKAFKLTGKFAKDGTLSGTPAKFALALKNQDLFTGLAPLGFVNDDTPKGMIVSMPVVLVLQGTGYLAKIDVKYSAKKERSGSGKK